MERDDMLEGFDFWSDLALAARIFGGILIGFLLLVVVVEVLNGMINFGTFGQGKEALGVYFTVLGMAVGYGFTFWRRLIGGIIILGSTALFAWFLYRVSQHDLVNLWLAFPYLVISIMYIAGAVHVKRQSSSEDQ